MNYTWQITKLGLKDQLNGDNVLLENAVVRVQWKRTAEDTDGIQASYLGYTDVDAATTAAADFTALNDLTNDQVLGWITDDMSAGKLTKINNQLSDKIERKRLRKVSPSW